MYKSIHFGKMKTDVRILSEKNNINDPHLVVLYKKKQYDFQETMRFMCSMISETRMKEDHITNHQSLEN